LAARVELEYSLTGMARNPCEVRPPHLVQPLGLIDRQHFAPLRLQLPVGGIAELGADVDEALFPQLTIDYVRVNAKT
jgi:hypothetical protein